MIGDFFEWITDSPWRVGLALVLILGVVGYVAVKVQMADDARWAKYAETHHCIVKGHKAEQVSTGVGPVIGGKGGVGIVTVVTPAQTIYECDGGELVMR